jgi:hypothetical protein
MAVIAATVIVRKAMRINLPGRTAVHHRPPELAEKIAFPVGRVYRKERAGVTFQFGSMG